ncbi:UNVERIFIED_CONTAM: hypothetical protein Slati_0457600 [Sesamum latifolium]|uniref:Uncharacterized protein n=1 Tax=Sesamum latifolium TaxID=2727402 RepID=A0AAW2XWC7_9LAMI
MENPNHPLDKQKAVAAPSATQAAGGCRSTASPRACWIYFSYRGSSPSPSTSRRPYN